MKESKEGTIYLYRLVMRTSGLVASGKDFVPYEAPATSTFRGLTVTDQPVFVTCKDKLDIDKLYDDHDIAAKPVDEAPESVEVVELNAATDS